MLALAFLVTACSLAYLTEHAGEVDAGPPDAGLPDAVVIDDVDAGWSFRADASMGFADLAAVWGSGPDDVWAVGYNMIVHWDGTTWSISPANVGPLDSVWGSSRTDVWAVGDLGAVFHYDGTLWLPADAGTSAALNGVWGSGAGDVWAVGEQDAGGLVLHWDGKAWSRSDIIDAGLNAVWGSSGLVWAAGNANHISEYKNGSWSAQDIQVSVPDDLLGVWGSSPTSVWAVSANGPLVYYDGDQNLWAPVNSSFGLDSVWGSGADDVWGVGFGGTIVHYDGNAWKAVSSPATVRLNGVWGGGPNDVWAVGIGGTILHHP
jgi:hypothetical protein